MDQELSEEKNERVDNGNRTRGSLLSIFLVIMIFANAGSSYSYFIQTDTFIENVPRASYSILYFLGALSLINIIFAFGIIFWKKWGVYGFYGVTASAFVTNLILGLGLIVSALGIIGAIILYLLTKNKWSQFS